MKATKIGLNTKGTKFAIVQKGEKFWVYKLCANYAGHVPGGIAHSWRYIGRDLTAEAAEALFARRIRGRG